MSEMVERVARAISSVQLWSRYNDWTLDHVPGFPVEICRYGMSDNEPEIVIVARFATDETENLYRCVEADRSRAALEAMREPPHSVIRAMSESVTVDDEGKFSPLMDIIDCSGENKTHTILRAAWRAAIDEALK